MALYPSLEDMKVDQMAKAQAAELRQPPPDYTTIASAPAHNDDRFSHLYPALVDYMGLDMGSAELQAAIGPHPTDNALTLRPPLSVEPSSAGMVAPLSGSSTGLRRAFTSHGVREVILCKDGNGHIGLRVHALNKGIFVVLVRDSSPAALAGLRFGDQILQINDETVAGYSMEKVHSIFKSAPVNGIVLAIRDRPYERAITLHKDSLGHIGFQFKDGKITAIVKDSSAARNGLLTEHNLLEINGQNVVGLEDKELVHIINDSPSVVTVTIIPSYIYTHMMKSMASSLKKKMDHGIYDF